MLGLLLVTSLLQSGSRQASCCSGMAQFANDPTFLEAHLSPVPFSFVAKSGHMVHWKAADGKEAHGFYVAPKKGNKASLILVHEYWGLNDYMKREAERINDKAGYGVLAVDLYDGKVTTDSKVAGEYMQGVNSTRATAIVKTAVADLKKGDFGAKASKIGTIGFCFGGGWSFNSAVQGGRNVQACVMFYGMPDTSAEAMAKLKAPVLMIHAKKDQWINDDVVAKFSTAMAASKHSLQVLHYDAYHAFANPSNPHYDQKDANDAMAHAYAFFREHLK